MPQDPNATPPTADAPDAIQEAERRLEQVHTARAEQKKLLRDMLEQQEALEEQDNLLADRAKQIEEQAAQLEAARASNAEREAALEAQAQQVAESEKTVSELQSTISEREEALNARESEVQEQRETFEQQVEAIKEKAEALKAESAAFAETKALFEKESAELRAQAEQLAAERDEIEESRSVLVGDNSRLRGELAAAQAAGAGAEAATKALEELRASLDARDEQVAKLNERLERAKEEITASKNAAGDSEAAATELAELRAALESRDASIAELTQRAEEARAIAEQGQSSSEEVEQLRTQLATATAELEELLNAPPAASDEPVSEQVAKRDAIIETLTAQLRDAESQRAQALKNAAAGGGSVQADLSRRDRLKAIRNSLRDKAARLSQAKAMIDQRQEEVEQILRLRSELASQREALQREKADIGKHNAKAGAGVATICAAIAILILAPVSWKIAGVFAPADHLSTATIELVSRDGATPSESNLNGFRASVDQLATDPKVVEQAATRMARRGIETYSDAPALAAALKDRLDVSHPRPGAVEVAFTDKGSLVTQRSLETYIASLVSAANDRASARMDNTIVVVSQAPDSTTPVSLKTQAVAAAGVWGGSSIVMMLFLTFIAVAMTKARERIRNEEAMLQSARDGSGIGWGTPGQGA